jgi:hypothetical protein
MDLLQGLNLGDGAVFAVICALLCVVGLVGAFVLQFITGALGTVLGVFELFLEILQGGPIAWCGCLLVVLICGACSFVTLSLLTIIPQCSTPDAVNLCRFLGY